MSDVIKADLSKKIAEKLANGESVKAISKTLKCADSVVLGVSNSDIFLSKAAEILEKRVKAASLVALSNIEDIASSKSASDATRLKASQFIVDKALEFSTAQGDDTTPGNMTQHQLSERLKALQKEAVGRAKPIDTGVLDLEDMTE